MSIRDAVSRFLNRDTDKTEEVDDNRDAYTIAFVMDGYRLVISTKDYDCRYTKEGQPVVYVKKTFWLKLKITENSFLEAIAEVEASMGASGDQNSELSKRIEETEIDGKKYQYFPMEQNGENYLMVCAQAEKAGQSIVGEIKIEDEDVSDVQWVEVFADIVSGARLTDEPNTTSDDILEQYAKIYAKRRKEESTLSFQKETVTFKVPAGYVLDDREDTDSYASETFMNQDGETVECFLYSSKRGDYKNAKYYIEASFLTLLDEERAGVEIQQINIGGRTCYYYNAIYKDEDGKCQEICMACNYGKRSIFAVEATVLDMEKEILIEDLQEFFYFGEQGGKNGISKRVVGGTKGSRDGGRNR